VADGLAPPPPPPHPLPLPFLPPARLPPPPPPLLQIPLPPQEEPEEHGAWLEQQAWPWLDEQEEQEEPGAWQAWWDAQDAQEGRGAWLAWWEAQEAQEEDAAWLEQQDEREDEGQAVLWKQSWLDEQEEQEDPYAWQDWWDIQDEDEEDAAWLEQQEEKEAAWREAQGADAAAVPPGGDDDDHTSPLMSLLLLLVSELPEVFAAEVLTRLDPIDRTFLAQVGGACRAAVAASDLPRAGTRGEVLGRSVWVVTHQLRDYCTAVERLLWAKTNGCPRDTPHTCMYAAAGGHLPVLQLAREYRCPWNEATPAAAARGGHLEVLKWLSEVGCPWDETTCHYAARGGPPAVLQWLRAHEPWYWTSCFPGEGRRLEVLTAAAEGWHLSVLQWVRADGRAWNEARVRQAAAACGRLEVLRWLDEHNY